MRFLLLFRWERKKPWSPICRLQSLKHVDPPTRRRVLPPQRRPVLLGPVGASMVVVRVLVAPVLVHESAAGHQTELPSQFNTSQRHRCLSAKRQPRRHRKAKAQSRMHSVSVHARMPCIGRGSEYVEAYFNKLNSCACTTPVPYVSLHHQLNTKLVGAVEAQDRKSVV